MENFAIRCVILCGISIGSDSAAAGRTDAPKSGTDHRPLHVAIDQLSADAKQFIHAPWLQTTNPNHVFSRAESVARFLPDIFGADWNSNEVCNSQFGVKSEFANLVGSTNQLIVSVNDTGRFCNLLVVVDKTPSELIIGRLSAWQLDDVSKIIYRAGENTFLAISQPWSDDDGANSCMAMWPFLYAFRDGTFINESASAPEYYRKSLQEHENALASTPTSDINHDCILMETERLRRVLDPASNGEVRLAASWANSPDRFRRSKAIYMLADAGGSTATSVISSLTADKDAIIADFAQRELAVLKQ